MHLYMVLYSLGPVSPPPAAGPNKKQHLLQKPQFLPLVMDTKTKKKVKANPTSWFSQNQEVGMYGFYMENPTPKMIPQAQRPPKEDPQAPGAPETLQPQMPEKCPRNVPEQPRRNNQNCQKACFIPLPYTLSWQNAYILSWCNKTLRKNAYILAPGDKVPSRNAYILAPGDIILCKNAYILAPGDIIPCKNAYILSCESSCPFAR